MKRALLTSTLLLSGALVAGSAHAGLSFSIGGDGTLGAARSAETAFLASLAPGSATTEDFESTAPGKVGTGFSTGAGLFELLAEGTTGACQTTGFGCDELAVLDNDFNRGSGPGYNGRYNTTSGGDNWLDSNDARAFSFSPIGGRTAVGFFITDANDAGGRYDITLTNADRSETRTNLFGGGLGNGRVYYLSFRSDQAITSIRIDTNNRNDGFGIDDLTVARVPEPGSLALLGIALAGIGAAARRRARR